MKLVLSLFVLAGVMFSTQSRAEFGDFYSSGWMPCGGWTEVGPSYMPGPSCGGMSVTYSTPYYSPRVVYSPPADGFWHDASGRRYVEIDGQMYPVVSASSRVINRQPIPAENATPAPPQATASKSQSKPSAQRPEEIAAPKGQPKENGLLGNPTRNEGSRTRYPGVEFFPRN